MSDNPLVKCPECGKRKLVRVISGAGLVFKGSGFYLTDYKKRGTPPDGGSPAKSSSTASADAGGGGEGAGTSKESPGGGTPEKKKEKTKTSPPGGKS